MIGLHQEELIKASQATIDRVKHRQAVDDVTPADWVTTRLLSIELDHDELQLGLPRSATDKVPGKTINPHYGSCCIAMERSSSIRFEN